MKQRIRVSLLVTPPIPPSVYYYLLCFLIANILILAQNRCRNARWTIKKRIRDECQWPLIVLMTGKNAVVPTSRLFSYFKPNQRQISMSLPTFSTHTHTHTHLIPVHRLLIAIVLSNHPAYSSPLPAPNIRNPRVDTRCNFLEITGWSFDLLITKLFWTLLKKLEERTHL